MIYVSCKGPTNHYVPRRHDVDDEDRVHSRLFKDIKGHLRGLVAGTLTSKKAFHFETKAGRSLSVWGFHPIALGGK